MRGHGPLGQASDRLEARKALRTSDPGGRTRQWAGQRGARTPGPTGGEGAATQGPCPRVSAGPRGASGRPSQPLLAPVWERPRGLSDTSRSWSMSGGCRRPWPGLSWRLGPAPEDDTRSGRGAGTCAQWWGCPPVSARGSDNIPSGQLPPGRSDGAPTAETRGEGEPWGPGQETCPMGKATPGAR